LVQKVENSLVEEKKLKEESHGPSKGFDSVTYTDCKERLDLREVKAQVLHGIQDVFLELTDDSMIAYF
jgi:hypothetical protein